MQHLDMQAPSNGDVSIGRITDTAVMPEDKSLQKINHINQHIIDNLVMFSIRYGIQYALKHADALDKSIDNEIDELFDEAMDDIVDNVSTIAAEDAFSCVEEDDNLELLLRSIKNTY